jgi:hypothetical protein
MPIGVVESRERSPINALIRTVGGGLHNAVHAPDQEAGAGISTHSNLAWRPPLCLGDGITVEG